VASQAEEYRAKAKECEELAEQTRDPYIREQMLVVARSYRQMAEHAEKRGPW
jgi:hypothetical protein